MTEANLGDEKFIQGIAQLRDAVESKCLTKGEAGLHVVGATVLKNFRIERQNFANQLAQTLNEYVGADALDAKFQASVSLGPAAHEVLSGFAEQKNVELLSAGWLELRDKFDRLADKRLIGVFALPNGRKGVGIFQVLN